MDIKPRNFINICLSVALAIVLTGPTQAATTFSWAISGGYYGAASGSWSVSTNWIPSGPANGTDNTADFSQVFFENPSTVTLDGSFTIGNIHFGDTKGAGHAWFLSAGSGGSLTLAVASGSPTITVDNQQTATISAVLAGSGFLKAGAGDLTLSGNSANTFTGNTTVAAGRLFLSKSSGTALGGNLIFTGGGVQGTVVSDAVESNNEQLVSTAVITFNTDSQVYGAWELRGFTQTVAGIADNGEGVIEVSQSASESTSNSIFTLNGTGSYTFAGRLWEHFDRTIGGTIGLIKNGTGTQFLIGRHIQYAGPTTVNQGRLVLGSNCVNFVSVVTNNATVELWANGSFSFNANPAPTFAGTGTVVKTGPDVLYFGYPYGPGDGGVIFSMGTNGLIDIQAGTLQNLNSSGNWTNNRASLNIANGAFLQMDANSVWVDALTGAGTVNEGATPFSQTLTVGVAGGSGVFSGLIQNTGSPLALVKTGTGTQTLSGANTYGGGSIVSKGTLLVDNTVGSGTGTGAVIVASGATLGGTGVVAGPVTMNGTLAPGNSPGTLTISNKLVMSTGAILQYDLGTNSDRVTVIGNLTLDGTLNVTDAGGFGTGTYSLVTYSGTLTDNGLAVGTTPNPSFTYTVDTGTSGQVKLKVVGPTVTDPYTLWQQRYFHCTTCPQAAGDADPVGKGLSNTNQFLVGLDPTNSASMFRIVSAMLSGNDVTVIWQAGGGKTNVLQVAAGQPDGSYTNDFHDIAPIILPGAGDVTTNYTDTGGATNVPARYYRVRLGP